MEGLKGKNISSYYSKYSKKKGQQPMIIFGGRSIGKISKLKGMAKVP